MLKLSELNSLTRGNGTVAQPAQPCGTAFGSALQHGSGGRRRARKPSDIAGGDLALDRHGLRVMAVQPALENAQVAGVGAKEEIRDRADERNGAEQHVDADIA